MAEGPVVEVTDSNFEEITKEGVTIIDYFAEWCGPCKMLTPVLQKVAEELKGQVKFGKLDIDKNHMTAQNHKVTSVPTLILFKDGQEVNRLIGLQKEDAVKEFALS